ncbi:hypothetical protein H6F76_19080 [Leptolyngbya sp. FACHB-321]|uniref:hypothetical protein n=1 Tax=Leptolyngbya sp. FACHB-321 TaxID=2692807 RepID=UPI0016823568|nr:hypothetical protein [Leptolyngbya sp. FACHB-321]MBD2037076.1 hypothetical protein [Leptolyngbya sp. FACHB-321]
MGRHPLLEDRNLRSKDNLDPSFHGETLLHRLFFLLQGQSGMKASILTLALLLVTGCGTLLPSRSAPSTQTSKQQVAPLNTSPSARSSPPVQRYNSDRQNQIATQGYNDGYEDGAGGFPASPNVGVANQNLTDPTEQKIYTDAYNRGYADGKGQQSSPSPTTTVSPSPTSTVLPQRRAELQRQGYQDGRNDAESGFAANPGSGITALGLTNPTERQIYTTAYNSGYQRQPSPSPSPSPTVSPGLLAQLRQDGYNDGYADARLNASQDANRGINLRGLVTAAEQRAYANGYNSGYQQYLAQQGGGGIPGGW